MAQIRLKNSTGGTSKIGSQVKLVVGSHTSFVNADFWDDGIIGTVSQSVPNGNSCLINLLNTVAWNDVMDKDVINTTSSSSGDIDGGFIASVYTPTQLMDGGSA